MSKEKILSVQLRKENEVRDIPLDQMTKKFYAENQEFIFCPNPSCEANIEYCSGKERTFYRSKRSIVEGVEIIDQHIEGCRYGIDHEGVFAPRPQYDPSIQVGLSEKHLKDSLMRAFKKHKDPEFGKPKNSSKGGRKSRSNIGLNNGETVIKGKINLSSINDNDETVKREPSLFQRNINDIGPRDFGEVRTVFGKIQNMEREEGYFTIKLEMDNGKSGRVFFGEQFRVLNAVQFPQLDAYKTYFELLKRKNDEIYGSFVGEIVKDDYDVSVYVSQHLGVCIDEKYHYDILRAIQRNNK